jgi:hypothetical protein
MANNINPIVTTSKMYGLRITLLLENKNTIKSSIKKNMGNPNVSGRMEKPNNKLILFWNGNITRRPMIDRYLI